MTDEKPKKSKFWAAMRGVGILAGLVTAYSSVYEVNQTEHAVVTSFGKPKKVIIVETPGERKMDVAKLREAYANEKDQDGQSAPVALEEGAGLRLKWPWQTVNKVDNRVMRWDGYPEEVNTRDKKYIWTDATARYFVEDPLKYFRAIRSEDKATAKLSDILDSAVRTAVTRHDLLEVVRTDNRVMEITEAEIRESTQVGQVKFGRTKIMEEISNESRQACHEYGIQIHEVGVLVRALSYVDSVKEQVEKRMISERDRISAKYLSEGDGEAQRIRGQKERETKRIASEGYKLAREIEGAADAEATTIYAKGFNHQEKDKDGKVVKEYFVPGLNSDPEFYEFTRAIGLYENGLGGEKKASIIIGTDNPLFRYVKGKDYLPATMPKPAEKGK